PLHDALPTCPSRRAPMVGPDTKTVVNTLPQPAGALGDYACCVGTGTGRNDNTANGAFVCSRVPNPPNVNHDDNPPGADSAVIPSWGAYTSVQALADGTSNTFLIGEKHVPVDHFGQHDNSVADGPFYSGADRGVADRGTRPRLWGAAPLPVVGPSRLRRRRNRVGPGRGRRDLHVRRVAGQRLRRDRPAGAFHADDAAQGRRGVAGPLQGG